jgi:hypothetical protein
MSLDMKFAVALAPVCLIGMVFSLIQGDWWTAGILAINGVLFLMVYRIYRTEKRPQRRP